MTINFTGSANIIYKSPKEFGDLIHSKKAKEVGIYPNYYFSNKVTSKKPMYSQYANTCTILSVNDTMVHLAPEIQEFNLKNKITDFIKEIKDKTGDLTAFVIGGKSYKYDKQSFNFLNDIGNILDKEGADFSMIGAKKNNVFRDNLYKDKNNFVFTQEGNLELEKSVKDKNITPEKLQETFENYYDIVDISSNHKIINEF